MLKRPKVSSPMVAFSVLSLLILLLSACGTGTPTTPGSAGNTNVVKGGTWIDDLFEEPDSLIPNGSQETFSDMVDQAIWAPLFYGDKDGHVHPGLATEIPTVANGDVSADLTTWKFKLRPNVQWSDGTPFNADDVNYTWKLWTSKLDPAHKFTPGFTTGFNLITSADVASDKMSITFHLSRAFSPFVSVWADGLFAPLPAHHFSSISPDKILGSNDNLKPAVASGPFMVSESKLGDHYTVVRNPKYYRASEGFPYLDKVIFRIVPNQDTILKDLQAGSIDSAWFLDVTKTVAYNRLKDYKLTSNPAASNFEALYFNFQNPILGKDLAVRQAIAMAIDHQALIDTARRGEASPLCTDHGKSYNPGYQPDAACTKLDPQGAATLLDNDGWKMGSDGYRHKSGKTLDFRYSTTARNLWRADDQLIIQSAMKTLGIKIDIINYPAGTFFGPILNGGNFDIAEFENSFSYDADDSSLFECDQAPPNGGNYGRYCNPTLDNLYKQEQATDDTAKRQAAFNQIHDLYLKDFPFIVLYSPLDIAMVKNGTQNYLPGPEGASETVNIWEWACDNGKCPA